MPATDFDLLGQMQVRPPSPFAMFYKRTVRDEDASEKEGRAVHKAVEYIKIQIPGDRTLEIDKPASAEDRKVYQRQYEAFLQNKQDEANGQPLKSWPGIAEELAEDFIAQGVKTLEQLAAITDGNIENLGPLARTYREKARVFIESAKGAAPVLQLQNDLQKEREHRESLERQLAELTAAVEKQNQPRRGRPPKIEE